MAEPQVQKAEEQMKKVIQRAQSEFSTIRTGRAHASLLDGIKVDYHGTMLAVNRLANVSVADARTIEIKPWDKESAQLIEQAILKSDLGVTPANDGNLVRLTLPTPTMERRKEMVRLLHKQAEDFRVSVRNVRRDAVEEMKKQEKEKKISKDDLRRLEQSVQKLTDHYVKTIDDSLSLKEKELLEV